MTVRAEPSELTANPNRASAVVSDPLRLRRCACGGRPGLDGECAACREQRLRLSPRAQGRLQPFRQVTDPGDALEREADRIAAVVTAGGGRRASAVQSGGTPLMRQERPTGPAPPTSFPAQQTLSPDHELEVWKKALEETAKLLPGKVVFPLLEQSRAGTAIAKFLETPSGKATTVAAAAGTLAGALAIKAVAEAEGVVPERELTLAIGGTLDLPKARDPREPPEHAVPPNAPKPLVPTVAEAAKEAFVHRWVQLNASRDDLADETRAKARELGPIDRMTAFKIWLDLLAKRPVEGERTKQTTPPSSQGRSLRYQFKRRDDVGPAPGESDSVVEGLASPGRPLEPGVRCFMEAGFGYDFGAVRIHIDEQAARSAASVDALAYTVGHDIVFGAGQYAPNASPGKRLLAHELAHVVQQGFGLPLGLGGWPATASPVGVARDNGGKGIAPGTAGLLELQQIALAEMLALRQANPKGFWQVAVFEFTKGPTRLIVKGHYRADLAASGPETLIHAEGAALAGLEKLLPVQQWAGGRLRGVVSAQNCLVCQGLLAEKAASAGITIETYIPAFPRKGASGMLETPGSAKTAVDQAIRQGRLGDVTLVSDRSYLPGPSGGGGFPKKAPSIPSGPGIVTPPVKPGGAAGPKPLVAAAAPILIQLLGSILADYANAAERRKAEAAFKELQPAIQTALEQQPDRGFVLRTVFTELEPGRGPRNIATEGQVVRVFRGISHGVGRTEKEARFNTASIMFECPVGSVAISRWEWVPPDYPHSGSTSRVDRLRCSTD